MSEQKVISALDTPNSYVGKSVPRPNAKRLVEGRGNFVDNINLPRMVHLAFHRSPYAHAKIVSIDTEDARAVAGVVGVFTMDDLKDIMTPWVGTLDHLKGIKSAEQWPLANGKVFWQEGIHVPLYIDIPDALLDQFTVDELLSLEQNAGQFVSIIDLFPTILDLYNIPQGKQMDGSSLLRPYPETLIRVYMIPEEFAVINSSSGEKYHVDNTRKLLRYTRLREDPGEQNQTERRLDSFVSIQDVIDLVGSQQRAEKFELNQ